MVSRAERQNPHVSGNDENPSDKAFVQISSFGIRQTFVIPYTIPICCIAGSSGYKIWWDDEPTPIMADFHASVPSGSVLSFGK